MKGDNILFLDTESDTVTKEIESVQLRWNGENIILTPPIDVKCIKKYWDKAEAVIIHKALYDMGVLSTLPGNSFEWVKEEEEIEENKRKDGCKKRTGSCRVTLFGHEYNLVNLNNKSNLIMCDKKSTPVIDTLKLYSIFIESGKCGLKELGEKYLGKKMIHYSKENAKDIKYQTQDVEVLDDLWYFFLDRVKDIKDVEGYTLADWSGVCTTATTTRKAAKKVYPEIGKWKKWNDKQDEEYGLTSALERAYFGGLTCAMYRSGGISGPVRETAWFDINASYANAIKNENIDRYNKYAWVETDTIQPLSKNKQNPILCKVSANRVFRSVESSLKVFGVEEKFESWFWSYDIITLRSRFPDADITILEAYKPIGLNFVTHSIVEEWIEEKDWAEEKYGKDSAPRLHAKTKSNAYYGVRAQREPHTTEFTDLPCAGIITSRGRLTLSEMIDVAEDAGCQWLYSDTDSICVKLNGNNPSELKKGLNESIAPYSCDCEFIGDTYVLAVKRYVATNGVDLEGNPVKDKISVHGRGQYDVEPEEIKRLVGGEIIERCLKIGNIAGNTERTYNRVLKLNPEITNPHPFMFEKNVPTDVVLQDWFDGTWFPHLDSKTTYPEGCTIDDEFERKFPIFRNLEKAEDYYRRHTGDCLDDGIPLEDNVTDWDAEDRIYFGEL